MQIQIEFFSHQIKTLREAKQLTQEELAHELGISRQSIIALERGRCLPSLPLALSLADVFDLVLEDIIQPVKTLEAPHESREVEEGNQIVEQENHWFAQIKLPEDIDEDKIEAEVKNGVLHILMPKK
jgi:putative transcriptional regulator